MATVVAVPDLHCPFQHPDALRFTSAVLDRVAPDRIVMLGDEIDSHAVSNWPKSPEADGANRELLLAKKQLVRWYNLIRKADVCKSNHTFRAARLASAAGIPSLFMKEIAEVLDAPPGWKWHDSIDIDGVNYSHGHKVSCVPTTAMRQLGSSFVVGHIHHPERIINWHISRKSAMFGMYAGCLIDEEAYAFAYHQSYKPATLGIGVIVDGHPWYVRMNLKANGKWDRKLRMP